MNALLRSTLLATVLLAAPAASQPACPALLDEKLDTLMQGEASLCQYRGKVLLVVNTASRCGFTPQYEGLERIYRKFRDRGLVVLGFPSNDFGEQEPGNAGDIARFCEVNYGVSFPMFAKSRVAAGGANPFYEKLARASASRPRWNFHKYLVDRRGEKVIAFPSEVAPEDRKLVAAIERLLAER
jgi:glutathione peroxidase